jgi:methylated-DNA-[protein]-cysteine S-methyltransferase
METALIRTPLGIAKIKGDEHGVQSVTVLDTELPLSQTIPAELEDCVHQLKDYFEGNRQEFSLTLNPQGTDFQKKVWIKLADIPFGKTRSYLEQSKVLGDPKAIRAVAAANGKNPLWIIIPCHRVIGSDGSLTGYAGGLWRKKWLLEHESPVKQTSLF